jgi:hypothetical protein
MKNINSKIIKKFKGKIILPPKKNKKQIEIFFKKLKLGYLVTESRRRDRNVNEYFSDSPFKPELLDLYNLYQFITLNKRTTVIEFGTGYSTLIFHIALENNRKKYYEQIKKLRRNNPFELFSIDDDKNWIKKIKKKITTYQNKNLSKKSKIHYHYSKVKMALYNGKLATEYKNLPICNPDFIYIDGPSQFAPSNKINGISTCHIDMMPMVCDVLKFEYFFTPGTIIVTDGRGANAMFLKDNFKRNWIYGYEESWDQHIFYLNDNPIGPYNKLQLQFYRKNI